ncbi:MAG: hypothetical protein V1719_01405, partial [Patescibacteria group bacterium]
IEDRLSLAKEKANFTLSRVKVTGRSFYATFPEKWQNNLYDSGVVSWTPQNDASPSRVLESERLSSNRPLEPECTGLVKLALMKLPVRSR